MHSEWIGMQTYSALLSAGEKMHDAWVKPAKALGILFLNGEDVLLLVTVRVNQAFDVPKGLLYGVGLI